MLFHPESKTNNTARNVPLIHLPEQVTIVHVKGINPPFFTASQDIIMQHMVPDKQTEIATNNSKVPNYMTFVE